MPGEIHLESNDGTDFESVFQTHYNAVLHYAYEQTHNTLLAEDLTQEAFTSYFEKAYKTQTTADALRLLRRIIHNKIIDHRRKPSFVLSLDDEDYSDLASEEPSALDQLLSEEAVDEYIKAIKKLDFIYYEILHLKLIENLTSKEIAKKLNISIKVVDTRFFRAKKMLCTIIEAMNKEKK